MTEHHTPSRGGFVLPAIMIVALMALAFWAASAFAAGGSDAGATATQFTTPVQQQQEDAQPDGRRGDCPEKDGSGGSSGGSSGGDTQL